MDLTILEVEFDCEGYWSKAIDESDERFQDLISGNQCVNLFDQNGYDLCPLEQLYAEYNCERENLTNHRGHMSLMKNWIVQDDKLEGYVLNHSMILKRKGYTGEALEQLKKIARINPLVMKLINIKPKWGIDVSIDYVSFDENECFELFHYEWDTFNYQEILVAKKNIENLILITNFDVASQDLIRRKSEWIPLDFFTQSDWRCNYFRIPPERFKMVVWNGLNF
jgi:hypothetical protein